MGKKSREKWERRERGEVRPKREKPEIRLVAICKGIILIGTGLLLFAPLIVSGKFYFPFVGPKSIYFMGLVEIIFAAWLILIISSKEYRPRFNLLLVAIILFVGCLILSSVFGADFSRSFWSKYERMTGLLMWFHLLAFFLVISFTFQKKSDWFKIFYVSIFVAVLISFINLFPKIGVNVMGDYPTRGGATIGNSSFLGTYLLFNIFLALYLFLKSTGGLKIYSGISLAIISSALFLSGARASIFSVLGGATLLFLLWLTFCKKGKLRLAGVSFLIIFIVGTLSLMYLALQPDSFVYQKMVQMASKSRVVVWQAAWQGFLERPRLGWGPENFELVFTKYFDPRLALREYGREVWFDRAHNIIFDTLVASGIVGFLSYLGIFLVTFYVLWRKYFREKLDFWIPSIFSVILISYSVQNLTVFDMVNSYLMFFLVLGFIAGGLAPRVQASSRRGNIVSQHYETQPRNKVKSPLNKLLSVIILIIFCFSFFKFVIQPLKADAYVIKTISSQDSTQRLFLYKKTLEASPVGKYQIREFFGDSIINFSFSEAAQKTPIENIIKEFDFVSKELEKSIKESPLDYRAYLKLGRVYSVYSRFDPTKFSQAEETLKKAIELSPRNQQTYWALAQTRLYQKNYKEALSLAEEAVELEPRLGRSHLIVVQIAQIMGEYDLAKKKAQEAVEIDPSLSEELKKILGE